MNNSIASPTSTNAAAITRASKSSFTLAFALLSKRQRRDMETFYAFCRLIDDIADDTALGKEEKRRRLAQWREAVMYEFAGEPTLARAVRELIQRVGIERAHFQEILNGVEMDIEPQHYRSFEELRAYCYRVASAVGLVSIEIFGCREPASKDYAIALGLALQITNILRDVGEDFANGGRVYLPLDDLARFGYTIDDLAAHRHDARFLALMNFEAARAESFYEKARAEIPAADRRALLPAQIMSEVYFRLLKKMRAGGFQVFVKRARLGRLEKLLATGAALRSTYFGRSTVV